VHIEAAVIPIAIARLARTTQLDLFKTAKDAPTAEADGASDGTLFGGSAP